MAIHDKATSFDIAALAGVSQPTVSRALRGDRTVSEPTRLRIEAIAKQLNYRVDKNASSLRRGQSKTLALLFFEDALPDDGSINPFFLAMLGSILRTCAERGYDLLTSFQQLSSDWHMDFEDSRKADGIILLGYGDYAIYRAREEYLVRQGTHFVRWGAVEPDNEGRTIGCDNFRGGYDAGRHLIERGRRRIAFIGHASDHYPEFRNRYLGLCAAMAEAGLTPIAELQIDALSTGEEGHDAAALLCRRGVAFDAIFAASDLIGIGAIGALAALEINVPTDVAVVGFDDIPAATFSQPPLTTIAQDYRSAGERLVETLICQIMNVPTDNPLLAGRLVIRCSS
jgi:DNA-binding LacI/PurR family transcriptional regulator|uniref:LacI family DNA-binding transcriptional regulator n=1 Tax=Sphingomonas sp. TaxID=28214 RepID=UPI0025EEB434|nr:substrate-binding domain-containing protein [Sphingomonas sp.]